MGILDTARALEAKYTALVGCDRSGLFYCYSQDRRAIDCFTISGQLEISGIPWDPPPGEPDTIHEALFEFAQEQADACG